MPILPDPNRDARKNYVTHLFLYSPIPVFTIFFKYVIMSRIGFIISSRQFGRTAANALTFFEKVSFFRTDVAITAIFIPLLILAVVRFFPKRVANPLLYTFYALSLLALFANYKCFEDTGRFFSTATLVDAVVWGWKNPEFISMYIGTRFLAKLAAGISFFVSGAYLIRKNSRFSAVEEYIAGNRKIHSVVYVPLLAVSIIPWINNVPATPYHNSVYYTMVHSFIENEGRESKEYIKVDDTGLIRKYRTLTQSVVPGRNDEYWGKAAKHDVIFFIIETGPARYMQIDENLEHVPCIRKLRQNSFIGTNHFSTYPYTSRAWFSILSSIYPSNSRYNFTERPPVKKIPGVIRSLSDIGYVTAYYAPCKGRFGDDEGMYNSLGFAFQKYTENSSSYKTSDDIAALGLMLNDINQWIQQDKRYCVAFAPLVSHAPWRDMSRDGSAKTIPERGKILLSLLDSWLGEIFELLQKNNRLNDTIIVVTADHGIRTREEDPVFSGGMIDEYSFKVPLMIYAPRVLDSPESIPHVTSHIDISPTVLDLLGIGTNRDLEQGFPIWNKELEHRTTFLFAKHFLGADGYYRNGKWFMVNHLSGAVYVNDKASFSDNQVVPRSGGEYDEVINTLKKMVALQEELGRRFIDREPARR